MVLALLWRLRGRFLGGSEDDLRRADGAMAIANGLMIPAWTLLHVYWLTGFSAFAALLFAWDWWRKRKRRKRRYKQIGRIGLKNTKSRSIEDRPKAINQRLEYGHWEGDCVVGKRKGNKAGLFTLSERLTREELIVKV